MSGHAQPAEIDGEHHREENPKQKVLDSKNTVPKLTDHFLTKAYGVNLSTGSLKSDGDDRQQISAVVLFHYDPSRVATPVGDPTLSASTLGWTDRAVPDRSAPAQTSTNALGSRHSLPSSVVR